MTHYKFTKKNQQPREVFNEVMSAIVEERVKETGQLAPDVAMNILRL